MQCGANLWQEQRGRLQEVGTGQELAGGGQELVGGVQGVFSGQRWLAVGSWLLVWVRFCLGKNQVLGLGLSHRATLGQAVDRPAGAKVTRALESRPSL